MSFFTVFGGRGFIGSEIVNQLKTYHHDVWVPERDDLAIYTVYLGTVIYCAGNGDCKNSPFGVLDANVLLLANILQKGTFDKLIYLSSTRVYMNKSASLEADDVLVCSDDARRLFNLTKLVGEELCLKSGKPIIIVRPSNVYGVALNSPLFLPSITRNAINNGAIDMYISKEYAKDYVAVEDVAYSCIALSECTDAVGKIINVASGINTTAANIALVLQEHTGCQITWHHVDFPREIFPTTDITNLTTLLPDFKPRHVLTDLKTMIINFKKNLSSGE